MIRLCSHANSRVNKVAMELFNIKKFYFSPHLYIAQTRFTGTFILRYILRNACSRCHQPCVPEYGHSDRKAPIGLLNAALNDWKLIVKSVTTIAPSHAAA